MCLFIGNNIFNNNNNLFINKIIINSRSSPVLKNSEAVYPTCRKRPLLDTGQLQFDC